MTLRPDDTSVLSRWSNEDSLVVTEVRKRNVVPTQEIERARHDELMAQQAWHGDDCGCDYCRPLDGVSRSATFAVAMAPFHPEYQPAAAEERPRLTLKVEK